MWVDYDGQWSTRLYTILKRWGFVERVGNGGGVSSKDSERDQLDPEAVGFRKAQPGCASLLRFSEVVHRFFATGVAHATLVASPGGVEVLRSTANSH